MNKLEALRYLAIHIDPWEMRQLGLGRVTPYRKSKQGTKPRVTNKFCLGPTEDDTSCWAFPCTELTALETRIVMAKLLSIAVNFLLSNHMYQFNDRIFLQIDGVPTGLNTA